MAHIVLSGGRFYAPTAFTTIYFFFFSFCSSLKYIGCNGGHGRRDEFSVSPSDLFNPLLEGWPH